MRQNKIGKTDISASALGLGTWAMGGWMWGGAEEKDAIAGIHAALDNGINLIDTAPAYGFGLSEQLVGKAIQGKRDKVILSTKCGLVWDREKGEFFFYSDEKHPTEGPAKHAIYRYLGPESIREELEKSLKRLGTDYIDVYFTHWQDSTTPISETRDVLEELKREGKIRAFGASNASVEQMRAYGNLDAGQEKYSMLDRDIEENGLLKYSKENQISMFAYSPLAMGLLTGKMIPDRAFEEGDQRRNEERFSVEFRQNIQAMLKEYAPLCEKHGATVAQLVIAWTCAQPGISHVLCGARNPKQAQENARAGEIVLADDELQKMDALLKKHVGKLEGAKV